MGVTRAAVVSYHPSSCELNTLLSMRVQCTYRDQTSQPTPPERKCTFYFHKHCTVLRSTASVLLTAPHTTVIVKSLFAIVSPRDSPRRSSHECSTEDRRCVAQCARL